ncbi:precorrin-2 C(20)-methyltransferase [Aureimonas endophytica]|uniref:Precorrin-2 C(20)-methyltransferase n=1 Tax=Aureimonas endophytica TaxID=2027858 RepID=A0A917E9L1_9HYPH|nr:precorrin-2 C(20)-methyltransferase [Aureimonas endophytica]GGE17083.1 precorrin-2 C(20)-methyltransferase [Aureimonas endophytica]
MTGRLYGLGLGPGDPELLTLKAARLLAAVPVIAYPHAEGGDSLARRIAAPHLPGGQIEIPIGLCMTTARRPAQDAYDAAAAAMTAHLAAGRDVAALCEGDPFFYSSFMYLFERLAARFPVEIVPGVSSLGAAAALARRPLAARNDGFAVVPAPLADAAIARRLEGAEGFAILKLGRHFARVKALLATLGLAEHCTYVENATMPGGRALPLAETGDEAPYFSLILGYRGTEPALRLRSRQAELSA